MSEAAHKHFESSQYIPIVAKNVIKEYPQKDNRVTSIEHKENKNAGGARNFGIKARKVHSSVL